LSRAVNIYPLAFLINLSRPDHRKIKKNQQHLLFFSGLRGAMAFALAMRNTSTAARQLVLTTTAVIVFFQVIAFGSFTGKLLIWLNIKTGINANEEEEARRSRPIVQRIENDDELNQNESACKKCFNSFKQKLKLFKIWHNFDNIFMKPLLTNARPNLMETMPNCCRPITKFLTTKEQQSSLVSNDVTSNVPYTRARHNSTSELSVIGSNMNVTYMVNFSLFHFLTKKLLFFSLSFSRLIRMVTIMESKI
jgi:solute carrier family 9 (sodium/hydrogen exchanger), member 6/7